MELSELRRKKRLTQEELAELVGVTRGSIANWEAGNSVPYFRYQRKLAEVLGVDADEIEFKGTKAD